MHRSKRTIEKSCDKLRDRLNCHSKNELIAIAAAMADLGYF
jgi:hypothetical protein